MLRVTQPMNYRFCLRLCSCMPFGSPLKAQGVKPITLSHNHMNMRGQKRWNIAAISRWFELWWSNFEYVATGQDVMANPTPKSPSSSVPSQHMSDPPVFRQPNDIVCKYLCDHNLNPLHSNCCCVPMYHPCKILCNVFFFPPVVVQPRAVVISGIVHPYSIVTHLHTFYVTSCKTHNWNNYCIQKNSTVELSTRCCHIIFPC